MNISAETENGGRIVSLQAGCFLFLTLFNSRWLHLSERTNAKHIWPIKRGGDRYTWPHTTNCIAVTLSTGREWEKQNISADNILAWQSPLEFTGVTLALSLIGVLISRDRHIKCVHKISIVWTSADDIRLWDFLLWLHSQQRFSKYWSKYCNKLVNNKIYIINIIIIRDTSPTHYLKYPFVWVRGVFLRFGTAAFSYKNGFEAYLDIAKILNHTE